MMMMTDELCWLLLQKEVAKHHAEMLTTMPDSCWSDRKSFWSFMTSWLWAGNAECVKHFEAMEIDPFWEVPPTKVFFITIFFLALVLSHFMFTA